ncbi:uncharacterized protein A4U43_C03F40 [Asparagus officinalis]|uniref:F-box domain-containing protein n=1 Tax=Asparagus officinalis TaxID=4686 RepID=A0A5P1F6M9_ASPOF|nr:uncharacterized protein LOC109832540 [Asparagus officinalis]XP_020255471.1 uncharacterized protein LOC109832540 [Asparagus officinalis]ONK73832.1 uncharacterized protein A4U43_C03F40 [Asparagus officinalis]
MEEEEEEQQQQHRHQMEAGGETHHIPVEIVKEILDRLPLETLDRFKCVSKLWYSLINPIIDQRLLEDFDPRLLQLNSARQRLKALSDELKGLVNVNAEELRLSRVEIKAMLDEMLSFWSIDGDVGRGLQSLPRFRESVSGFRDNLAADADEMLCAMDALIEGGAGDALQDA